MTAAWVVLPLLAQERGLWLAGLLLLHGVLCAGTPLTALGQVLLTVTGACLCTSVRLPVCSAALVL
jgi:hypothetical protein